MSHFYVKPEPAKELVNVDSPLIDTGDSSKQSEGRSTSSTVTSSPFNQLLLPATPATIGSTQAPFNHSGIPGSELFGLEPALMALPGLPTMGQKKYLIA
ncbi:hypothetical protein GOBAR_DD11266 [Gossypium barbadense]|nr:hypothetical protein GOBAR_DD11266 [Gossypium barbadense]